MDDKRRRFDLVIFGATGFTGSRLAKYIASSSMKLTWAIAGRDPVKLAALSSQLNGVTSLLADVSDPSSLRAAASTCTVVLNCVGPFRFFGEPVVQACVSAKTNYVDITGEPEFMERMEMLYHDAAKQAGILIMSASAFDSIPADLGSVFAVDTLRAAGFVCTEVEEVLSLRTGSAGMAGHFATYESAVHGLASAGELRALRAAYSRAHPEVRVVTLGRKAKRQEWPFWHAKEGRWALTFPGSDSSVVRRSQRLLSQGIGGAVTRPMPTPVPVLPIQFSAYFTVPSLWAMASFLVYGGAVSVLSQWAWGRRLLLAWPGLFTAGLFSHNGPTDAELDGTAFDMKMYARGYPSEALPQLFAASAASASGASIRPPPHSVEAIVRVSGPEPGYVATPRLLLAAARTILEEGPSLPTGVLTPAAAFGGTKIIDRCCELGVEFTVVEAPHRV